MLLQLLFGEVILLFNIYLSELALRMITVLMRGFGCCFRLLEFEYGDGQRPLQRGSIPSHAMDRLCVQDGILVVCILFI